MPAATELGSKMVAKRFRNVRSLQTGTPLPFFVRAFSLVDTLRRRQNLDSDLGIEDAAHGGNRN
jgi:hypothetical protein